MNPKKKAAITQNYMYLLRMIQEASSLRITLTIVAEVISNFFRIFYSVLFFAYFMEQVSQKVPFTNILWTLLAVAIINVVYEVLLALYRNLYVPQSDIKISVHIREKLYQKILSMDIHCFDDSKYYDEVSFALSDAYERSMNILSTIASFSSHLFCAGVLISFFGQVNVLVILIALVSLLIGLLLGPIKNRSNYFYNEKSIVYNRQDEYIRRVITQSEYSTELRTSNIQNVLHKIIQEASQGQHKLLRTYIKKVTWLESLGAFFGYAVVSFIITLIALYEMMISQTMSVATFLPLLGAVAEFTWRASSIIQLFNQILENNLYISKLRAFMERQPKIISTKHLPCDTPMETLRLRNVGFRYTENGQYVLSNINFEIKSKQKVAIVGYNGAGKSTLVNLLLRLYDSTHGCIEYNGVDIRNYALDSYQNTFGVLFQDIHVYATSVKENIAMDKANPPPDTLNSLAEAFNMKEQITSMSNGYETELTREFSENGELLSGGQMQNLALMRLYYNPFADIYILDEPTSALDPLAEARIFETIEKNSADKTIFFISHRFSSSKIADKIIFLKDGQIIEEGTHDELIRLNGEYAYMFNSQAQYYRE